MYRDKTLIPTEAIRLLALGLLAEAPRSYADLALGVREFASQLAGPSLDLLGPPIELLRHEGFVSGDDPLTITETGIAELRQLLESNIRTPLDHVGKVVVAAKFRFLHMLDTEAKGAQLEQLATAYETERARLEALAGKHAGASEAFDAWLGLETAQIDARLAWLAARRAG